MTSNKLTAKELTVEAVEDHPDGSCTIQFEMSAEVVSFFAAIGLQKVLMDKAMEIIDGHTDAEGAGDAGAGEGGADPLSGDFPGF